MRRRGGLLHVLLFALLTFCPQPAHLSGQWLFTYMLLFPLSLFSWTYIQGCPIDRYEGLRSIERAVERASWCPLVLSRLSPCDLSLLVTLTFLSKRSNFLQIDSQNHSGLLSLLLSGDGNYQQKDPKRGRTQIQLFWGQIQLPLHWGTVNGWQWTSDLPARRGEESLSSWGQGGEEGTQGLRSTNLLRTPTAPRAGKP